MQDGAGWLQISTEGFATFNKARPPEHLVKELVQNAFDAVEEDGGDVFLDYHHDGSRFHVTCTDMGPGFEDLSAIRVVYLTFKTDSHLKRGRFGRGFKEILSVAQSCSISSRNHALQFVVENGKQVTHEVMLAHPQDGTRVAMTFDWPPEMVDAFDAYFARFLLPAEVGFFVNGKAQADRDIAFTIDAALPTEVFDFERQSWRKALRKTEIELVKTEQPPLSGPFGMLV